MPRSLRAAILVFGAASVLAPLPALAQTAVIERNLPAPPVMDGGSILLDDAIAGSDDRSPFGVDLAGIALIGAGTPAGAASAPGVSLVGVDPAYAVAAQDALAPFLGQPLSPALITELQGAVARVWREAGTPFVSVTVPPQEITSGVLSLRVTEFTAGAITSQDPRLPARIRQRTGERILVEPLNEDLAWANRNPFREVGAVFAPGDAQGASDIELTLTRRRPVQVYAGWDDTGSEGTGRNRFFLGGGAWLPAMNDATLAFRYTRSRDLFEGGSLFDLDEDRPGYLGAAGRLDLPTWPRQALSVAPNYVETVEFAQGTPFSFRNRTVEVPVLYRTALSNLVPGLFLGDIYAGAIPKRLTRQTRFTGIPVADGEAELMPFVLGWSHILSDDHGRTAFDLRLDANPGGILSGDTRGNWLAFSGGRVTDNRFVHATFDVARTTILPRDLFWTSTLTGRIASDALPDTERLGVAGFSAVRGYRTNEAAGDTGLIWRNELRLPALSPLESAGLASAGLPDLLSPFLFLDAGLARDIAISRTSQVAGTGVGFDYALGRSFEAGFTASVALVDADHTRAGDWTLNASLRFLY